MPTTLQLNLTWDCKSLWVECWLQLKKDLFCERGKSLKETELGEKAIKDLCGKLETKWRCAWDESIVLMSATQVCRWNCADTEACVFLGSH